MDFAQLELRIKLNETKLLSCVKCFLPEMNTADLIKYLYVTLSKNVTMYSFQLEQPCKIIAR